MFIFQTPIENRNLKTKLYYDKSDVLPWLAIEYDFHLNNSFQANLKFINKNEIITYNN